MADHHGHSGAPGHDTPRRPYCAAPAPARANAFTGTAASSESDVALAAIADMVGLICAAGAGDGPGRAERPGRAPRRGGAAGSRAHPVDVLRCRIVWRLMAELSAMAGERDLPGAVAGRRRGCHVRQIAIYLSHVVLSVPYRTIAVAFGRDRTTVVHACAVVEDRRDDVGYDRFVERCERCIEAVFAPFGGDHAGL
ncbi:helix-turn-helix domain-containing protein [Hoeflea sp. BAL378]|uniref:helix-turn-helix domain-containing protein n=1 Tax=Hoeflea sp. BAL378 TaxID=1547437 RepID=UPI000B1764B5|nr:helix-turn-helix domain-containing protein [Hoeflea sp. BAL378]